uniref:Zinc finger CCCH domain-containing protein 14 n=1 Tax=Culicoides sonorensis TaxID=179676 RepID=A0A336MDU3_CULSO
MDNIGSEIGQKMRCAVKAKLIELGTGYIDDELPDYVMIMVANKRSKQQMVDDLNLFLGSNTQIFVTWLHEVLEKLQEVTLPAPPPPKIKKVKDHDKKDKKKDKKKKEEIPSKTNNLPILPPITEVIKEGFIQRAKKDLQIETAAKIKTKPDEILPPPPPVISQPDLGNEDEFDIPTITDIAKEAVEKQRKEKELQQLEELQKKIYIAKKQLQTMVSDESDDDFNVADTIKTTSVNENISDTVAPTRTGIHVNPKFFDNNEQSVAKNTNKIQDRLGFKPTNEESETLEDDIKERRVVKLSAVRRAEREIYVPAFRRNEIEKQKVVTTDLEKSRSYERRSNITDKSQQIREPLQSRIQMNKIYNTRSDISQDRLKHSRRSPVKGRLLDRSRLGRFSDRRSKSRSRSPMRQRRTPDHNFKSRERSRERRPFIKSRVQTSTTEFTDDQEEVTRKRIGSRVFVMPIKAPSEEGDVDVPVNSVIKIKPRAHVPENKQASKMLLLKAVAEAQKSTFGSIPNKNDLVNKSRQKRSVKDRLMIEVALDEGDELDMTYDDIALEGDEYVPEPVSKTSESESDSYLYIPKKKAATKALVHEDSDGYEPDTTKFVVTLDSNDELVEESRIKVKRPVKERIGFRMQVHEDEEAKRRRKERFEQGYEKIEDQKSQKEKSMSPQPPPVIKRIFNRKPVNRRSPTPQDRRREYSKSPHRSRSPVYRNRSNERKSDFWGDRGRDETSTVNKRHRSRARTISPINFDLTDEETRSRSSHEEHSEDNSKDLMEDRRQNEGKPKIKKLEPTRNFDNVPSLLSTVSVADNIIKAKPKERCKYFPNCRDGNTCEFHHPSEPCNAFPNCKFGDKCAYLHPKCKFDQTCIRPDCNYMHTIPIVISVKTTAPPLASSVLPSQNFKPITLTSLPAICKFFPKCSNTFCGFYHPRPCRFGKSCTNKIECNFYHQDLPTKDKLKWVSSMV